MFKFVDIPPVWLLAAIVIAWWQAQVLSLGLSLKYPLVDLIAGLLIGGGVLLTGAAALQFRRHNTTIIPHQTASRLIKSGIFRHSRNPIYLADVLILLGCVLWFDAVISLALVPCFVWIIERRFIFPEEVRLRMVFGSEFEDYCANTRRWV